MKNKKIRKQLVIGVASLYCVGSIIFLGGSYLKHRDIIDQQSQHIEEVNLLLNSTEEEVEELRNIVSKRDLELHSHNETIEALQNDLDSARREEQELEREIELAEGAIIEKSRTVSRGGYYPNPLSGKTITVKVTGYCPCVECCGEWAIKNPGITASGTVAKYGTIAAPSSIPFGTQMKIEGFGDQIFTVEDTGSAVVYGDGIYVIDVWMPTHEQAYAIGNSIVTATILN